jgi:uncharacterized membrane protein
VNKQNYLSELTSQLKVNNIEDIEEIIAEYEEHFKRKMADGYSEEEIATKLGKPKEIALQFAQTESGKVNNKKRTSKLVVGTGLFFTDLFVIPFTVLMYAWLAVLGATSIASAVCGICLIIRPLLPANFLFIPTLPFIGGVLWGVTFIAFGVLAALATVYCGKLTVQMWKKYRRWHKNVFSGWKYPPYSMHPVLEDRLRRKMRSVALIAVIVLGLTFIIGYIVMAASAGALGFWHTWHWFA